MVADFSWNSLFLHLGCEFYICYVLYGLDIKRDMLNFLVIIFGVLLITTHNSMMVLGEIVTATSLFT